jgi:hypothetical protein
VLGNITYTPVFDSQTRSYKVEFRNENAILQTGTQLYGSDIVYSGETPVKEQDARYTYTFVGWTLNGGTEILTTLPKVSGEMVFTAAYEPVERTFTVTWVGADGTTLETDSNVAYGTLPSYDGAEPTKAADEQYTYTFAGWDPEPAAITKDVTYTAQFTGTVRSYVITFYGDEAGTVVLWSESFDYGTTPIYGGPEPTKESDDQYVYTFTGWDPELGSVTGEASYKPVFSQEERKYYTVTWRMDDGSVLRVEHNVETGTIPSYGEKPVKEATDYGSYEFLGWDDGSQLYTGELPAVGRDVTYTAVFSFTPHGGVGQITTTLIITRGDAAPQNFLYTVRDANGNKLMQVVLRKGQAEVRITGLPLGDYTVTEETSWSWRYTPERETLRVTLDSADPVTAAFAEKGSQPRQEWLSNEAALVKKYGE